MAKTAAKKVVKKTRVSKKTVKTAKSKKVAKVAKTAKTSKTAKPKVAAKKSVAPAAKKIVRPSKLKKGIEVSKKTKKLERKKTRTSTKIEATKPVKHKVPVRETAKPSKIVNNDAPKKKAVVVKKPTALSEQAVLEKLKELFPASLGRKRVIDNVKLDAKQLKKLDKLPKFRARIPLELKRSLGIVDDAVREADEAEKAAKIRVVDTEKAKDASDILTDIEAAKAARGDVQTSKIIKAIQLRLNRRLVSVYGNYKKIVTQFNTFSSVAMSDLARMYAGSEPSMAKLIEDQVTKVSSMFRLEEANDYDYFESAGSKLDIDFAAPLDSEGNYDDEDKDGSLDNASLILPPENPDMRNLQATAAGDVPDHDSGSDSSYDDNDSMFEDDSSTDSEPSDAGAPAQTGKKKGAPRIKKNKINILGETRLKYADKAFMAYKNTETRNLFGTTKRAACVGFNFGVIDKHGNFSTSTQVKDAKGNVHIKSDANAPVHGDTMLPLHADSKLFSRFATLLGQYMGMRQTNDIGPTHVCSRTAFNFLKLHGFSSNYRVLVRNNADNTGRYGVIISVSGDAGSCRVLVIPFGIMGITHKEITVLCQGEFQDIQDKLFEYVSYSIITNGLMSQGKVFGFSKKERSLLEPPRREGEPIKDDIIKLANGHIYFLPDIDRRNEFASYRENLRLPDQLDDELIGEDGLTEYDKFVGSIAYVDHKSKIAFYYTKNGKLESTVFNGACALNARDCADIMKPTPTLLGIGKEAYDPTQEFHRTNMSPYGTVTLLPARYLGKDNVRVLEAMGSKYPDGFHGFYDPKHIKVIAEDLRTSFQGDKIYYSMVRDAVDNYLNATPDKLDRDTQDTAGNAYTLLAKSEGLTDLDWATASEASEDDSRERMTGRDATAIKIMLHIAAKSYEEWPIAEDWQKRAEDARVKPPRIEDLQDIIGQFDGLIRDENGNAASAMPHQAYTLHTLKHQETAALDCDMGGGKTFMSCLDATRWIKEGVHGKPARPCVVMPASLIENYMSDIKNNFFGSNLKFFVLSSSTRGWSKMDTSKIAELAKSAPANTMFVASYEWLGLDSYPVITGTHLAKKTLKAKDARGKKIQLLLEVPHTENIYPNAQLLLDIGINVLYLDESQKIKNPSSGFHKAVQTLSGIPVKRIMTGTMVTRDVDDVFTQTSFIDGTMIGTRARFQTMYCENGSGTEIKKGLEKKVRVHLMASGVMQLRRSMWMGLLPKKKEHFEFVTLDGLHGAVYDVLIYDLLQDDKELNQLAYYSNNESLKAEAKSLLNKLLTGVDSDIDDDPALKDLERMRADACGDVTEDDDELASAGRAKGNKVKQYFERKRSMAEKVSMLQAFISSPQSLNPEKFSKQAQENLKALNQQLPEFTAKDTRIVELIDKHWSVLDNKMYSAMSRQREAYGDNPSHLRGKVIVFALNISTVEHVYAYLKKSKYAKQVVRYLKSDAQAVDNLRNFKDPENEEAAIIVAAETSVIYGQNMQAADMMIKLTIPWTTGDYDQAVARIFRNGQKLNCEVYNVVANGTFEVAKLAKFLIRQNSNRKLISDYSNPYNMNHALGAIGKGSEALKLKSESDMRNFVYEDQKTGREIKLDLIAVHDTIYEHELIEAEKHIQVFRDAGYGDPTRDRIEIASNNQVVDAGTPGLRPKDADGVECGPGDFKYADMSYFDGENIVNARNVNRKSLTAEIKRQRDLELAQTMGDDAVNALNAKGADALLRQYMSKALEEVLLKHPAFKKFIPESGTKGFSVYLGDALRNGDFRLLSAKNMSYKNFAEVAGNDLEDPETRAELMTLARLVYNRVLSNYPGCVAIDDDVEVKYNKAGKAIDVIGHDEKKDRVLVKKNARVISSIVGNRLADTDKTETMKAAETAKQEAERKAALEQEEIARKAKSKTTLAVKKKPVVEDDDDIVQEDEEDIEEGINLGVSELVEVDDAYEGTGVRNIPTNDSVYVFAPSFGNDPKQLRKLAKVNVGVGRGNKMFEKKVMWVYNKPVSDMNQVVTIATAIENAGGFVEKLGKGANAKYAITTDLAAQALFRLKAPTNFSKIEEVGTSFSKHLTTVTAGLVKKAEVMLGLYCFDRRILVVAESRNEVLLRGVGFKRVEVMRVAFDRTSKLQNQLETCFARIRKYGINILNSETLARRLKIIAGKAVEV